MPKRMTAVKIKKWIAKNCTGHILITGEYNFAYDSKKGEIYANKLIEIVEHSQDAVEAWFCSCGKVFSCNDASPKSVPMDLWEHVEDKHNREVINIR